MDEPQFRAIAKLIRSRDPSREGARLVLIEGKSQVAAAAALGIDPATISKAIRRYRHADTIIRQGYGLASEDQEPHGAAEQLDQDTARRKFAAYFLDLKASIEAEGGKVSKSAEWERCIEHWIAEGEAPTTAKTWKCPRSLEAELGHIDGKEHENTTRTRRTQ